MNLIPTSEFIIHEPLTPKLYNVSGSVGIEIGIDYELNCMFDSFWTFEI